MKLKVCVLGAAQSGKSSLRTFLAKEPTNEKVRIIQDVPPLSVFQSTDKTLQFWIYELPSQSIYISINKIFAQGTEVFVYCVDRSQELTLNQINHIKRECQQLRLQYPNAQILLVGTKSDKALNKEEESMTQAFKPYPLITTSMNKASDHAKLVENIMHVAAIQKMKNAGLWFAKESLLARLVELLALEISNQPKPIQIALALQLELLVAHLKNPKEIDKATHIQTFVCACNDLFLTEDSLLLNVVKALGVALVVALLAGLLGYFIGFFLGAWSGPGAFFTGLAVGMLSALTVVGGMIFIGVATFFCSLSMFIEPSPLQLLIEKLSLNLNNQYPLQSLDEDKCEQELLRI